MVANNGSGEKPKATVGRKLKKKSSVEKTMLYCRKCQTQKESSLFMNATDRLLDSNGYMSICKECIRSLYVKLFQSEHTLERAMLRLCRILNWKYSEAAINATITHIATQNKLPDDDTIPGIYKAKLTSTQKAEIGKYGEEDLSFVEPGMTFIGDDLPDDYEDKSYLEKNWGRGLAFEDYAFLEQELDEWTKTHKSDTKAEITLLKEICFKQLEIQKARIEQKSTTGLVDDLQKLMKTASVDPAKTSLAGSGKSLDTFSGIISIIEQNEPADYYKDKKLFMDFDNIELYFKKFVTRPLKNFITQSRDFNVEQNDEDVESDDFDNITSMGENSE